MALKFELLPKERLAHFVAIANTPNFLYRHFREGSGIEEFAKHANVEELFEVAEQISHVASKSLEQRVRAYAVVVALTYKPLSEIESWLATYEMPKLHWMQEIIGDYRASYVSIQLSEKSWNQSARLLGQTKAVEVGNTASNIIVPAGAHLERSGMLAQSGTTEAIVKVLNDD